MKILFDHQTFTRQEFGGISRYFYELLNQGMMDKENQVNLSLLFSNNAYLTENEQIRYQRFFPGKFFKGKVRLQLYINELYSSKLIRKQNFDILHPTYYDTYFLKHIKNKPFTITYLDMIHEKFVGQFPELGFDRTLMENKRMLIHEADRVIAISQATKDDMVDHYGVNADKVEVIHLGSSFDVAQIDPVRMINKPYILYVGSRDYYKNFQFCLESISPILRKYDISLVCGGGGQFSTLEVEFIEKLQLKELVQNFAINDIILGNLYRYSEAFIFPSLYEGFGIPVLEAFSCGAPCLLSNGGSLPEVGGDAAIYFDPADSDSIKTAVELILGNHNLKQELIKKGEERLLEFSWRKTYDKTLKFYRSIL